MHSLYLYGIFLQKGRNFTEKRRNLPITKPARFLRVRGNRVQFSFSFQVLHGRIPFPVCCSAPFSPIFIITNFYKKGKRTKNIFLAFSLQI